MHFEIKIPWVLASDLKCSVSLVSMWAEGGGYIYMRTYIYEKGELHKNSETMVWQANYGIWMEMLLITKLKPTAALLELRLILPRHSETEVCIATENSSAIPHCLGAGF